MNFLKSVFSDDSDPPGPEFDNAPRTSEPDTSPAADASSPSAAADGDNSPNAWNFGGLLKTITARSESIIETYRRDLQEFGTGLKKEIEVAHGSLETVGQAIDQLGSTVVKGTAQIISQGKEAILAADLDSDSLNGRSRSREESGLNSKGYSRFDVQVRAIQGDASTYCEEPEDLGEFGEWKLGFSLEGKGEEMEGLFTENDAMESIYKRVVPNSVDHESFWLRYYYKVYKLKKAEDVRARLVRRMSKEDEDLSWDVEDDDDEEEEEEQEEEEKEKEEENVGRGKSEGVIGVKKKGKGGGSELQDGNFDGDGVLGTKGVSVEEVHDSGKVENKESSLQNMELANESVEESKVVDSGVVNELGDGSNSGKEVDDNGKKNDSAAVSDTTVIMEAKDDASDKKVVTETKVNHGKSPLVADSKHSVSEEEEEDLEWDEIEDISTVDEQKITHSGSPSKVDLRKRLGAAEEDEDLSWDIEDDDDEPSKA